MGEMSKEKCNLGLDFCYRVRYTIPIETDLAVFANEAVKGGRGFAVAVTIKDVSARCGLSISTVSKAFNNYSDISAETPRAGAPHRPGNRLLPQRHCADAENQPLL